MRNYIYKYKIHLAWQWNRTVKIVLLYDDLSSDTISITPHPQSIAVVSLFYIIILLKVREGVNKKKYFLGDMSP